MAYDEVVLAKLKPGKFVFNPTGIIQVLGFVFLLGGVTFYFVLHTGSQEAKLYIYSVPNIVVILTSFFMYLMFSLGYARRNPWIFVNVDIAINIVLPVIGIICSIVAKSPNTTNDSIKDLPLPFGVTGNVLLLISAATLFRFYRYKAENIEPKLPPGPSVSERRLTQHALQRPSLHI